MCLIINVSGVVSNLIYITFKYALNSKSMSQIINIPLVLFGGDEHQQCIA